MEENANSKVVHNSFFLYIRSVVTVLISLYSSRIVLQVLGVDDYGIFNVVGSVISFLGVINACMSNASSRFVSFALGEGNKEQLFGVFSTIRIIHWILAAVILILGESVGLWFVQEKLIIPFGRESAVLWCYQFSLFSAVISILSVPFNALILGYEKMDAYAFISIADAVLQLVVVLLLLILPFDKLVWYSFMLLMLSFIVRGIYFVYCKRNFEEMSTSIIWNKILFKKIFSFACWTFNGQLACVGYTQGINILMNLFFGPVVNAARGIAVQVQAGAKILVNNFQIALRPQMIKVWAKGDVGYMHKLVFLSSKFSFFLTEVTVIPLLVVIEPVLSLWLVEVPEHTVQFVRIVLYSMLVDSFCHGMIVSIQATGNIKRFQIWEGTSLLTVVPISWFLLKYCEVTPETVMMVYLFVQIITQIIRMWIVLPEIGMTWKKYVFNVFPRVILSFSVIIIPLVLCDINSDYPILKTFVLLSGLLFYVCACVYLIGLDRRERQAVTAYCRSVIHNLMHRKIRNR